MTPGRSGSGLLPLDPDRLPDALAASVGGGRLESELHPAGLHRFELELDHAGLAAAVFPTDSLT